MGVALGLCCLGGVCLCSVGGIGFLDVILCGCPRADPTCLCRLCRLGRKATLRSVTLMLLSYSSINIINFGCF